MQRAERYFPPEINHRGVVFLFIMKKKNRVRKAEEFQKIIHTGKKKVSPAYIFYYLPKKEEEARIGISLPKKIGHAVDRNLYKRQVRMMCQDLIDFQNYPLDGVIILRFSYRDHSYAANKNILEKLLTEATIK